MKDNRLTLKKLEELSAQVFKDYDPNEHVIKSWQYPLLWIAYLFIGKKVFTEGFTFYFVTIGNTKYLLKTEQTRL